MATPILTQDVPRGKGGQVQSGTTYDYTIMFVWDVNNAEPFFSRPISSLPDESNFPYNFIYGILSLENRRETFSLEHDVEKKFSLFTKVQEGKKNLKRFIGYLTACLPFVLVFFFSDTAFIYPNMEKIGGITKPI